MAQNKSEKLTSTKKLDLLFLIVKKSKTDYFVDLLQGLESNLQIILIGNGTTKSAIFSDEVGTKSVIIGVITEDNVPRALKLLKEKFSDIRDGKGIAFTVPLSSVMGVTFFNFLSNNKGSII